MNRFRKTFTFGAWALATTLAVGCAPLRDVSASGTAVVMAAKEHAGSTATVRYLADVFNSKRGAPGRTYVIGGLGSSVGAGATLPIIDDAPVNYFASVLRNRVPGASLANWRTVNYSVPGSTLHDSARDWPILKRSRPDIVVLAYGMNDGAVAQFDMGETFGGSMESLRKLVNDIRTDGAVPVILTTPSAHTARTDWDWPQGPRTPQQSPVDTAEPIRDIVLPEGTAREGTRYAAVNQGFRDVGAALDVDVIDVEPFWLRAVARYGEDAFFNANEVVHPNLEGHRVSYHAAIDAWLSSPWWTPKALRPGF